MNRPSNATPAVSESASSAPRTMLEVVDDCIRLHPFRAVKPRPTDLHKPCLALLSYRGGHPEQRGGGRPFSPEEDEPGKESKEAKGDTYWMQIADFLKSHDGQFYAALAITILIILLLGVLMSKLDAAPASWGGAR